MRARRNKAGTSAQSAEPPRRRFAVAGGKWISGIVATALAAALAGVLTGVFEHPPWADRGSDSDGPPLDTSVMLDDGTCTSDWYVPRPPEDIQFEAIEETATSGWPNYPAAEGGFPASPTDVYLTVQGKSDAEVMVLDIAIEVIARHPVPPGTLLHDRCGGPGEFRWLRADLDADPPALRSDFDERGAAVMEGELPESELVPFRLPYELSVSDAETFIVRSETVQCDCEWIVKLKWQSQGRSGTIEIDNHGDPFRTVSTSNRLATCDSVAAFACE